MTFEQRPLPSDGIRISATARLRTLGDDGRVREVGPPLLDDREIHGPISYGLARAGGRLYVLYPSPDDRARHNDVRVAEVELK